MDTKLAVGGRNKALNEVQGQVSLSSLQTSGGSGDVDGVLSAKGISLSGDGNLAQSENEKALSKHLQRFQYCYEKVLLTDPGLAGHIVAQWTIGSSGGASGVKILRTQLKNAGLQQCLTTEIAKVRFPSPKGGSVTVKYPFAFSSTTL